jgi:hypothetical protein
MSERTIVCWSCRKSTVIEDIVGRGDACPHCSSDLRCCKNCSWYDTAAANQCREPTAEFVSDKERANFCGMYKPFSGSRSAATDEVASAKAKLEALFRKI